MNLIPQFDIIEAEKLPPGGDILLFSDSENLIAAGVDPSEITGREGASFLKTELAQEAGMQPSPLFLLGRMGEEPKKTPLYCGSLDGNQTLPPGWHWHAFGTVFRHLPREKQAPFSRARQILHWERTHRYCGSCGTETVLAGGEPCRTCLSCGAMFYPRFSPAIIVCITRGRELLLAHNVNFPGDMYSHIAGFVETGESLEDAVRREVREEVSLEVRNIRYFDSQQWPMPHSLMLGFTAECPEGNPVPDGVEIGDARWFSPEDLPVLPHSGSIARRMIDDHLDRVRKGDSP
ncbi:MAG: NAD(+) diphosphatase [Spirochaetales bacterium]|nr:NAD(+) diphosphatase [Spirochaetales bacterium]